MHGWADLADLAGRQHGVFATCQLPGLEISPRAVRHACAHGHVTRLRRGLYAVTGWPDTPERQMMAALLAAGTTPDARPTPTTPLTVLGGLSAAYLWGMAERPPDPVQLVGPADRGLITGVDLLRSRTFDLTEHRIRPPFHLTCPVRTVRDAVVTSGDLDAAVELAARGVQRRRLEVDDLARWADEHPHAPGIELLRLVAARLRQQGRTDSPFERDVRDYLVANDVIPYPGTYPLRVGGIIIARLDIAFPPWRVYVEADGFGWHSLHQQLRADHVRQNEIAATGQDWLAVRVGRLEFDTNPERFLRQLTAVLSKPRLDAGRVSSGLTAAPVHAAEDPRSSGRARSPGRPIQSRSRSRALVSTHRLRKGDAYPTDPYLCI